MLGALILGDTTYGHSGAPLATLVESVVVGDDGVEASPSSATDAISVHESQFGRLGLVLRVENAGPDPDVVTIVDPTVTVMGSPAISQTVQVDPGSSAVIRVPSSAVDSSTLTATMTHSRPELVTYELYRT